MIKQDEIDKNEWSQNENGLILPKNHEIVVLYEDKESLENKEKINPLKSRFKWLIDNLTPILLLPSLLGASWQIIELSKIHISYIRFFSVSQIPVDGALVLFLLFLFYIIFKFGKILLVHSVPEIIWKTKENIQSINDNYRKSYVKNFIKLIMSVSGIILMLYLFMQGFPKSPILTIVFIGFFLIGGIVGFCESLISLFLLLRYRNKLQLLLSHIMSFWNLRNDKKSVFWDWVSILIVILPVLVVYLSLNIFSYFSSIFNISSNLENSKDIQEKILKDYNIKNYKVRYMNDKYIFVQLCVNSNCDDENKEKIVILQTEKTLFKD